jgi:hypothetical protein
LHLVERVLVRIPIAELVEGDETASPVVRVLRVQVAILRDVLEMTERVMGHLEDVGDGTRHHAGLQASPVDRREFGGISPVKRIVDERCRVREEIR